MATYTTNHVFHIGLPHLHGGVPCQDYTLSGTTSDMAYAVVADGCSSGGKTDVGARLVALSTAQAITGYWNTHRNLDMVAEVAFQQKLALSSLQEVLGLTQPDLLATALYAVASPQHGLLVHMQGDGLLALKHANGYLRLHRLEATGNAPLYPAYALNGYADVLAAYRNNPNAESLHWEVLEGAPDTAPTIVAKGVQTLTQAMEGYTVRLSPEEVSGIAYIALITDGATQVDGCPTWHTVNELLNFKSTVGDFAIRRMNRLLRDVHSRGKGPLDDLGYAVIHVLPQPQEV